MLSINSLANGVTLQRVAPLKIVAGNNSKSWHTLTSDASPKFISASIVAVNGSKTVIPLLSFKQQQQQQQQELTRDSDYEDLAEDSDGDGDGNLFEPQVILNTSAHDDSQDDVEMSEDFKRFNNLEPEEDVAEEEFCDVCSMELINHADDQPCQPTDTYVKIYKYCQVCDLREPTREHVSRHFMSELLEVVDCFPNPLACTQCDYQADMSTTVALHIALVHSQVDECLEDQGLVRNFGQIYSKTQHKIKTEIVKERRHQFGFFPSPPALSDPLSRTSIERVPYFH